MFSLISFVRDCLADIRERVPKKRIAELEAAIAEEEKEMRLEVWFFSFDNTPVLVSSVKAY